MKLPVCPCLGRISTPVSEWGLAPSRIERPTNASEAAQALAALARQDGPVWIVGLATRLAACPPVPARAALVGTGSLTGIVAYEPADLTLTVRGGTPLEEVHEVLAAHRLELPGSHFGLDGGTVGGALASGTNDFRRGSAGPLRDRILGMEVAGPDGRVTRSGGRVVKNVSGYDLFRLHAGAMGSLGLISEATLRLAPQPEAHASFERTYDDPAQAGRDGLRIALEAPAVGLCAVTTDGQEVRLAWVHEGDREWVAEGVRWSESAFGAQCAGDHPDGPGSFEARMRHKALEHICPLPSNLLLRANLLPSRIPELLAGWHRAGVSFAGASLLAGTALARLDFAAPEAHARARAAAGVATSLGGWYRLQGAWRPETALPAGRVPTAVPDEADVPWGGVETPWQLYARLKRAFDPALTLGPPVFARAAPGAAGQVIAAGAR